jgi:hypothetical protein
MSGQLTKTIWTYTLINSNLTIKSDLGISALSIVLVSGTGNVLGGQTLSDLSGTYASQPIDLVINQPLLISSDTLAVLSDIEISTTGTINLVSR